MNSYIREKTTPDSFIVEGNIGSGKSTFLRLLEEQLPVQMVYEPHTKWQNVGNGENLLERFYTDIPRWAYTFQSYAFITRIMEQQKRSLEFPETTQIIERSVYSDRYCFAKNCFEMGAMSALEWQLYQDWFSWLVENYAPRPTGFIYLQTDPDVCFSRLTKRARHEEVGVQLSYLQSLHDKHESWLLKKEDVAAHIKDVPVLILSCNDDFEHDASYFAQHLDEVRRFIQKHQITKETKGFSRVCL